jgi:hypothetical protein
MDSSTADRWLAGPCWSPAPAAVSAGRPPWAWPGWDLAICGRDPRAPRTQPASSAPPAGGPVEVFVADLSAQLAVRRLAGEVLGAFRGSRCWSTTSGVLEHPAMSPPAGWSAPARAMERRDWASGSRDCRRAQITQICAYTGGTVTRQSAAPNGGSARVLPDLPRRSACRRDRARTRRATASGGDPGSHRPAPPRRSRAWPSAGSPDSVGMIPG